MFNQSVGILMNALKFIFNIISSYFHVFRAPPERNNLFINKLSELNDIGGSKKAILIWMILTMDKNNCIKITFKNLSSITGYSRSSLILALEYWQKRGVISKSGTKKECGLMGANLYFITTPK